MTWYLYYFCCANAITCYSILKFFGVTIKIYNIYDIDGTWEDCLLACRERQSSIVLETYVRFEMFLRSILCMQIARMEIGTSQVSGDSDIIT